MVDHSVFVYQKEPVWVLARSIAVCFFKFEDSVGRRVYVDMVLLACVPGDLIMAGRGNPPWAQRVSKFDSTPHKKLEMVTKLFLHLQVAVGRTL